MSAVSSARAGIVVLVIGLLAFSVGTLGEFVYDDHYLIEGNPEVQSLSHLSHTLTRPFWSLQAAAVSGSATYYRPLITLAYTLQYALFGPNPLGYHLVSLGLHLLATWLAFSWLARRIAPGADAAHPATSTAVATAAALGAALFALHPTRVESVTWISGCTDLLMGVFVLLALAAWDRLRRGAASIACGALLVLAFLSKEVAVVVPFWLLVDTWLRATPSLERNARLRAALVLCGLMLVAFVLRAALAPVSKVLLANALPQLPQRVLATFGELLRLVVWPWPSSLFHALQHRGPDGLIVFAPQAIALGALGALGLFVMLVLARTRPGLRPWLADLAFFVLTLLPVLNVIPLGLSSLVAERFLYLPLLGIAALVARAALGFSHDDEGSRRGLLLALAAPLVIAMAAGVMTRSQDFMEECALWEHEVALQPRETSPLESLTMCRIHRQRFPEALALAQRGHALTTSRAARLHFATLAALALAGATPDADRATLQSLATFYDDLYALRPARLRASGTTLQLAVRPADRLALDADPQRFAIPSGLVHARVGDFNAALAVLGAAARKHPHHGEIAYTLAQVQALAGAFPAAQATLAAALAFAPHNVQLRGLQERVSRARQLLTSSDGDAAVRALKGAHAYLMLGAPGAAADVLDRALAQQPDQPELVATRAQVEALDGNLAAARARIASASLRMPHAEALWQRTLQELTILEAQRGQLR